MAGLIVTGLFVLVACLAWRSVTAAERERAERTGREASRAQSAGREPARPALSDWQRFKLNLRQRYGR